MSAETFVDANLLLAHGVTLLLTQNVSDFRRFGEWIRVESLASQRA